MNAATAAKRLGVNERTIRRAIQSGRLSATKVNARCYDVDLEEARVVCFGNATAALYDALERLREVGYDADANEIQERFESAQLQRRL